MEVDYSSQQDMSLLPVLPLAAFPTQVLFPESMTATPWSSAHLSPP